MKTIGQCGGNYYLYRSILSIILGILLLAFPEVSLKYLVYVIGAFTILMGTSTLISVNKSKAEPKSLQRTLMTTNGAINLVLGIILIIAPTFFLGFLMTIIGLFIIIAGLLQLFLIWQRKRSEQEISYTLFILPLLIIAAGFLVLFNPFQTMVTAVTVMGAVILLYGIFEFIIRMRFRKLNNCE